jgi:hypothetical protein
MKNRFTLPSFLLLFVVALLTGCNKSTVAPFANQDHWDAAKKQRWTEAQEIMKTRATYAIEGEKRVHRSRAEANHWTTPSQLQAFYDSIEQRRTGNPNATSCRRMTDLNHCDYSRCSLEQLTAEFFQYDEELHQRP